MDWKALILSLQLGLATAIVLLPVGLAAGRLLARRDFPGKAVVEAAVALPLVLPPTVLGYYLLVAFGAASPLGASIERAFGGPLVFSFAGLVVASTIANLPFAIQPIQRAFESIPDDIYEAAAASGMSPWRSLRSVELPLAWSGVASGMALTFAHTLGEFGVVLMVGGSIPGETRTAAIAIYDRVQAFDEAGAGAMAAVLLAISVAALAIVLALSRRVGRRHG